ncbi:unnamed protein product [Cylindrotheca closterium]|uniref:Uncharacterized protein n=1 Tax=Cylindrotheca closterium TaxID=2856 RepID=A0AAD2CSQ0_9STRA|nr:unnamed protein product [Cylindrotheca closterium]
MAAVVARPGIPKWLSDHCDRLQDEESQIQNLNLNIRRLNVDMIHALCDALMKNNDIETINLTSALFQDQERGLVPLMKVLRKHPSLRAIHLSYNRLRHVHAIEKPLRSNDTQLRELYLDYNRLNCDTAMSLANVLKHNTKLTVLQLNSNRIGDVGGEAIALAMKDNTTLKFLGMRSNQLGKRTANAMFSSLRTNMSLTTLQIDKNPDLKESVPLLTHIVQSNRAGRYLLGQKDAVPHSLWTLIFQQLECDMLFFFLSEHPELVMR